MSEDAIYKIYSDLEKNRATQYNPRLANSESLYTASSRWQNRSFRSKYFNVGSGMITIAPGDTQTLATKVVPSQHSGVLTGFTQFFSNCECAEPDVINSIVWGLRINGERVIDFPDFVGEFSKPYLPCEVFFPLLGEANGDTSVSPGGSPTPEVPTVSMLATNNNSFTVVLQARLIGYSFPIEEVFDEFGAY